MVSLRTGWELAALDTCLITGWLARGWSDVYHYAKGQSGLCGGIKVRKEPVEDQWTSWEVAQGLLWCIWLLNIMHKSRNDKNHMERPTYTKNGIIDVIFANNLPHLAFVLMPQLL